MRTFCFSPFTDNVFCFFVFAAGFLFSLAFFGTNHYRKSRTVPVYCRELSQVVTTAPTVISSALARMCVMFTWLCSPLYDLSIHSIKTLFFLRSMFYATKQLSLEMIFHVRLLYLALICLSHARVHEFACKQGRHYFYSPLYMSFSCQYQWLYQSVRANCNHKSKSDEPS